MLSTSSVSTNISIVRIIFEFYPIVGGSVIHTIELSKKINPYLKNQIIIAPKFNENCGNFDTNIGVKILRVRFRSLQKISVLPVLPFNHISYSTSVYFELKKMTRPDIIHAHGIINIIFCSIIGKHMGIPVVGMLHGSISAYSKIYGLYETFLAMLFKPDHCFVLDDGSSSPKKFKKLWGDRVTVVCHGIDTDLYRPMEKDRELMAKLGFNESDFIILSSSNLTPVKNIDLAVKSFKKFMELKIISNVYLLIAGGGPIKKELIKLTNKLEIHENVKFLDKLAKDDIVKYISISDVVIATSLYSNMNRSIQEAMSCGKPVVVFDSGNTRNLIKHKENGILVKSGDLNNFAQSIKLLYESLELRIILGNQARKTILNERSWDERIQKELAIYNQMLVRK